MTEKQAMLNAQYRAVRSNYLRNIRSMEQRGYVFDRDVRPDIPKKITPGSIRRLEKLNKNRYDHAYLVDPNTGEVLGKGQYARTVERQRAAKKSAKSRAANEARSKLDQMVAAIAHEMEGAEPGSSVEGFFNQILQDLEGIVSEAETNDELAIHAAYIIDENWDDIQDAIEIISRYEDIESAPFYYVDKLIMIVRAAQGRAVTQEDMRMAGNFGEEPDYYP